MSYIKFNGRKYWADSSGRYYYAEIYTGNGKKGRYKKALHHAIWEFYTGQQILKGYSIHHKDGNTQNNSFENLELIEINKHKSIDMKKRRENPILLKKYNDGLIKAREKAKEWHRSPEGREWHRKHTYESISKTWK